VGWEFYFPVFWAACEIYPPATGRGLFPLILRGGSVALPDISVVLWFSRVYSSLEGLRISLKRLDSS